MEINNKIIKEKKLVRKTYKKILENLIKKIENELNINKDSNLNSNLSKLKLNSYLEKFSNNFNKLDLFNKFPILKNKKVNTDKYNKKIK
jgi:hypothetical protein